MKADSGLPSSSVPGEDFELSDIFRASNMASLLEVMRGCEDSLILVVMSDGDTARIATLGDMTRAEMLGVLALADEAVNGDDS